MQTFAVSQKLESHLHNHTTARVIYEITRPDLRHKHFLDSASTHMAGSVTIYPRNPVKWNITSHISPFHLEMQQALFNITLTNAMVKMLPSKHKQGHIMSTNKHG